MFLCLLWVHSESANKLVTCNDKCKKMKDNVSGTAPLVILTRAMYCIKLEQSYFTYDTVAFPFEFPTQKLPTQKLVLWQGAEPILHFRCLEVSYDWGKKSFNQEDWTPLCAKVWCSRWENGCASLASFHRSRKGQRRVKDGEIGQHKCALPASFHGSQSPCSRAVFKCVSIYVH